MAGSPAECEWFPAGATRPFRVRCYTKASSVFGRACTHRYQGSGLPLSINTMVTGLMRLATSEEMAASDYASFVSSVRWDLETLLHVKPDQLELDVIPDYELNQNGLVVTNTTRFRFVLHQTARQTALSAELVCHLLDQTGRSRTCLERAPGKHVWSVRIVCVVCVV
jgi:hypothetical protein